MTAAVDEKAVALATQLLAETREELVRADSKAAMLFAVFGIALGVVLAGIVAGDWAPSDLAAGAEVVWWLGAASAALGLVAVGAAVWPHLKRKSATGRVTYFGHVIGYRDRQALIEALARQASDDLARPIEQLEAISGIVMVKYRLIRWALGLSVAGAATCAVAVLAS